MQTVSCQPIRSIRLLLEKLYQLKKFLLMRYFYMLERKILFDFSHREFEFLRE